MADITTYYSAKIFPFPPNWAFDVKEKIFYPSDLMSSYNETEQRVSLVETPVRTLAYRTSFFTALDASKFAALVYGWQHKVFGVPWWPMASELLATAEIGATVLNVNTARMRLGDLMYRHVLLLLWRDPDNWEYAELADTDTFDAVSIEMYDPLVREWPAGTLVVPFAWCRMASFQQPTDLITDAYAAADVAFESACGGILGWDCDCALNPEETGYVTDTVWVSTGESKYFLDSAIGFGALGIEVDEQWHPLVPTYVQVSGFANAGNNGVFLIDVLILGERLEPVYAEQGPMVYEPAGQLVTFSVVSGGG